MDKQQLLEQLQNEGFSELIIKAFEKTEREKFIPQEFHQWAYENNALPTINGSTISQPSTIAFMLSLLELEKLADKKTNDASKDETQSTSKQQKSLRSNFNITNNIKILEIGSGSGYVIALIHEILQQLNIINYELIGLEIINELVEKSRGLLKNNKKIKILKKSGSRGFPEEKPFDRIIASASFSKTPIHLFEQLKETGILVCPIKNSIFQFKKINNTIQSKECEGFAFVPMEEAHI